MLGKNIFALTCGVSAISASVQAATLEAIHCWMSGSEQHAVNILGKHARPVTGQCTLGRNVPGAAQLNTSQQVEELSRKDLLLDLTPVTAQEGWFEFIRPEAPCLKDGRLYCIPLNIVRWLWTHKKVFAQAGAIKPRTWKELLKTAETRLTPLSHGGQSRQDRNLFDDVIIGMTDAAFWYQIWRDKDARAAAGKGRRHVSPTLQSSRSMLYRLQA